MARRIDDDNPKRRGRRRWSFSQERAFQEQLVNQRFHFMLVFLSLIGLGALNADTRLYLCAILVLGAIVTWVLALVTMRAQMKLDWLLEEQIFTDEDHPAARSNDAVRYSWPPSMRRWIGYGLPVTFGVLLSAVALLAVFGVVPLDK